MLDIGFRQRTWLKLTHLASRSFAWRQLAYLLMGWAMLLGVRAEGRSRPPLTLTELGLAIALLFGALVFLTGPVLSSLQPGFQMLGYLSAIQLATLAALLLNVWRYLAGKREIERAY